MTNTPPTTTMTKDEITALMVETDFPRAAEIDMSGLERGEIKVRMDFADPEYPERIAAMFGKIVGITSAPITVDVMRAFAKGARDTINAQAAKGLVPYYSIPQNVQFMTH
jgi:hypothetical protein